MISHNADAFQFEKEWVELSRQICQAIYTNPKTQEIKNSLQKKGYMTLEEKSEFINISDETKYKIIYEKYGPEGSEGYKQFFEKWNVWFKNKGVVSQSDRSQRSSVDHILFSSTPDPEQFLLHFEHEILGSMKE